MLLSLVLAAIIIILLLFLSMIWPPNSPWAPWWRTNRKTARAICSLAKITRSDIVYDLGCGDGTLIVTAAKEYGAKAVGIEIDPLRAWIARVRVWFNRLQNKIEVRREDFFLTDLSEATVVVVYLVPRTLEKLLPKFKKELKKGTRIISYKYDINLEPQSTNSKFQLLLYKI
jgi:predicted RNA methylase